LGRANCFDLQVVSHPDRHSEARDHRPRDEDGQAGVENGPRTQRRDLGSILRNSSVRNLQAKLQKSNGIFVSIVL
jgi:hypothetical protein